MARRRIGWAVATTLFAAFALTIFPLPDYIEPYRPDWVALTVMFWVISLPSWIGVGIAWACGIVLDTLMGALLGQHAIALAVAAYLAFRFRRRIRVFPIWQETFAVLMLLIVYHLLLIWIEGSSGRPLTIDYLKPILTSVLVWPLWSGMLNAIVRQSR